MNIKKVPLSQYQDEVTSYCMSKGYTYTMTGQTHQKETPQHKEKLPWCIITIPGKKGEKWNWFVLYALSD